MERLRRCWEPNLCLFREMDCQFSIIRRVEFPETDMAGLVHFSNYFRYMEAAEHAFYRSIGLSVATLENEGKIGLPRVHASCDYLGPLHFEDKVEVRLVVEKITRRSVTYGFYIRRLEPAPKMEAARGRITVVAVRRQSDGRLEAVALPDGFRSKLESAGSLRPAQAARPGPKHQMDDKQ
jgi:YbgC/YbaW family acyl-CoA thioester hydrolase